MLQLTELADWERRWEAWLTAAGAADAAHDLEHTRRVVRNARQLAAAEGADPAVVLPAAWLHDCVAIAKDDPRRSLASQLAAEQAVAYLRTTGYPTVLLPAIQHAIAAHSFSAGIAAVTIEARVVQDADRLDAIGAVGLARCLLTGAALQRPLYDVVQPFPLQRRADDHRSSLDHFFTKLLRLEQQMTTAGGRQLAAERTAFLREFLRRFADEISTELPEALLFPGDDQATTDPMVR
jgi:uncharacterized protein